MRCFLTNKVSGFVLASVLFISGCATMEKVVEHQVNLGKTCLLVESVNIENLDKKLAEHIKIRIDEITPYSYRESEEYKSVQSALQAAKKCDDENVAGQKLICYLEQYKNLTLAIENLHTLISKEPLYQEISEKLILRSSFNKIKLIASDSTIRRNEALKNDVFSYVSLRSVNALHAGLRSLDRMLDEVDKKAYGGITLGTLAFKSDIQKVLVESVRKTDDGMNPILSDCKNDSTQAIVATYLVKNSCQRFSEGKNTGILSDMLDSAIIGVAGQCLEESRATQEATQEAADKDEPEKNQWAILLGKGKAVDVRAEKEAANAVSNNDAMATYVAYLKQEQATRRLMIRGLIEKRRELRGHLAEKERDDHQSILDELDEKRIEEISMTALAPEIHREWISGISKGLPDDKIKKTPVPKNPDSNNELLNARAIQAVATLNAINVNANYNVNTFSASYAPVVNVNVTPFGGGSFCNEDNLARDVYCVETGQGYLLRSPVFPSGSWQQEKDFVQRVSKAAKSYRSRTGKPLKIKARGYASLIEAKNLCGGLNGNSELKKLAVTEKIEDETRRFIYQSKEHFQYSWVGCGRMDKDGNDALSGLRAAFIAKNLEEKSDGSIRIMEISAKGKHTALMTPGDNRPEDRVVFLDAFVD